jgi:hypothetical protein
MKRDGIGAPAAFDGRMSSLSIVRALLASLMNAKASSRITDFMKSVMVPWASFSVNQGRDRDAAGPNLCFSRGQKTPSCLVDEWKSVS